MGEGFRPHPTGALALQGVIADAGGGIEGLLQVALLQGAALGLGLIGPYPRKTIGLQFEAQATPARPREVEQPKPAAMLKQNQPEPDATMSGDTGDTEDPAQGEPAKVVSLDQFRKK